MPHYGGEPSTTNTDIFQKVLGVRTWLGQWSGAFKSLMLPLGLLDLRILSGAPANPPAGWGRLHINGSDVKLIDKDGNDLLQAGTTFTGLSDTPGSYSGQGSKLVAVNSGATALEFITAAAAPTVSLKHYAYPWLLRRDFANHTEGGAGFFDRESLMHYPGWTVTEDTTGANGNGTGTMDNGEELDGLSPSRRTTYVECDNLNTEEGWEQTWDLRIAVPDGFSSFGSNGIILRHKIGVAGGAGSSLDTGVLTITVFDPSTGSDTSAASASRTRTAAQADDTVYQDLQITGSTLNALSPTFAAGNMLHLRIHLDGAFGAGTHSPTFRLGRLEIDFGNAA